MTFSLKAVFINGVLKPLQPLPLPENQPVALEVTPLNATTQLTSSSFASLYGIWQDAPADLDNLVLKARRATNSKLQRLIHTVKPSQSKRKNGRRHHVRH